MLISDMNRICDKEKYSFCSWYPDLSSKNLEEASDITKLNLAALTLIKLRQVLCTDDIDPPLYDKPLIVYCAKHQCTLCN